MWVKINHGTNYTNKYKLIEIIQYPFLLIKISSLSFINRKHLRRISYNSIISE